MNLLVDTSVWSLALRRDGDGSQPEVRRLARALAEGDSVFTTGLILQELLQGFRGPRSREALIERFGALPLLVPAREDHIRAAELRNACRRRGVQVGTIDALIAALSIHHQLTLLTANADFHHVAEIEPLELWRE